MLSIAALVVMGYFQEAPPPRPAPDTVVATVGGAPITAGEIEPYLWAWKSKEVIRDLAGHRAIAAEAARLGITASSDEVKKRIADQIERIRGQLQPGQSIDDVINGAVGGPSRLALVARSSILVDKIAESEFKPDGYVKVATLLFRTNGGTTDELSKAIKSADSAYASLQQGKPWADVLRLYEKNPQVVQNGGLIGWKAYSVFPETVRTQLGTLKLMGVTKPVQTEIGIQIFRLLARGATANPTELADLKSQYVQGARQGIVERIRQQNKVEIK
jgi:parvulin-like peptidyl-prolyl isomerase